MNLIAIDRNCHVYKESAYESLGTRFSRSEQATLEQFLSEKSLEEWIISVGVIHYFGCSTAAFCFFPGISQKSLEV